MTTTTIIDNRPPVSRGHFEDIEIKQWFICESGDVYRRYNHGEAINERTGCLEDFSQEFECTPVEVAIHIIS